MERGLTTTTLEAPGRQREGVAPLSVLQRQAIRPLLRSLVVIVGVFVLLASAYSAVTHWRSEGANAVSPPLVPGTRIGQTFVSRYPGLSGLEVRVNGQHMGAPGSEAILVLHLREAPGSSVDIATSTLKVAGTVDESQYQLFTFPAIAASEGKTYYAEIESPGSTSGGAPALLWWVQNSAEFATDPYGGGTAYLNGAPQQSDVSFGLRYNPAPVDAFRLLANHAAASVPEWLVLLLLAAATLLLVLVAYLAFRPKSAIRNPKSKLPHRSLPVVLAVALAYGVLFSVLVPPWQGPDEHGHFVYAALLYRHGMDDTAVQALEWGEGQKDHEEALALKSAVVASMGEHEWTRRVSGHPTPGAPAFPPGGADLYLEMMWQIRQPAPYYWLCAASIHLANAFGAGIDPFVDPGAALRVMRLVSVLVNVALVGLAWLAGALLGGRRLPWLRFALPLTVALLPMHAFIGSVVSNDVFSDLVVTAMFVSLVALLKWPYGLRGLGFAALSLLLLLAGSQAKLTAFTSGGPLLLLGFLVWAGLLLTLYLPRWRVSRRWLRPREVGRRTPLLPYVVPALVLTGFLLAGAVFAALMFTPGAAVAAWQYPGGPSDRPVRVSAQAHSGSHSIEVRAGQLAFQWVELPWPHPAYTATVTFWAQAASATPSDAGTQAPESAALIVNDQRGSLSRIGAETLGRLEQTLQFTPTVGEWQQYTVTSTGTRGDRKVWVQFAGGRNGLYVDDVSLRVAPLLTPDANERERQGMPQEQELPLTNPSMETGSLVVSPLGKRLLRGESLDIVDVLVNPQVFDKVAIWQRYAYRQFRSFWGNFGWLSIPLPELLFAVINLIIVVVLGALAWTGLKQIGRWRTLDWLGFITLVALTMSIVITFARMMGPLSTSGIHTDPQGRYIFGYTVPVVWLLIEGLVIAWSGAGRLVERVSVWGGPQQAGSVAVAATTEPVSRSLPWGAWLWCASVCFFTAYSLTTLILPYYYR